MTITKLHIDALRTIARRRGEIDDGKSVYLPVNVGHFQATQFTEIADYLERHVVNARNGDSPAVRNAVVFDPK